MRFQVYYCSMANTQVRNKIGTRHTLMYAYDFMYIILSTYYIKWELLIGTKKI